MNAPDRSLLKQYTVAPGDGSLAWEGHMADEVAATSGPEPLAKLLASDDELELKSTRGNFRLPRNAVTRLGRGNFYPWFFSAIRIHYQAPGIPRDLQFKPLHLKPRDLLEQLGRLGYPVR